LKCIFVDNGLLRKNEEKEIEEMFTKNFSVNFNSINAKEEFLKKLKGIIDPEQKRKIIGEEFIILGSLLILQKKMDRSSGWHKVHCIRM